MLNRYCRRCGRLVQVWNEGNDWHLMVRRQMGEDTLVDLGVYPTSQAAIEAGFVDHFCDASMGARP